MISGRRAADELAAELLAVTLEADPLAGSLFGFPGYDGRLVDFGAEAERETARRLAAIAERADAEPEEGLGETEHQTLDFVRHMARGMADAAAVPIVEFTICDTFVDPVGGVLTMLPKVPLDTSERRDGYLARMRALPTMLAEAARRHAAGTTGGRTAVARLVEAATSQLGLLLEDPTVGGIARTDQREHDEFSREVSAQLDQRVRPALAVYRDTLQSDVLPAARDDEHPGICFLPDGEAMYGALTRLHTSTTYSPEELHAMGREIVDEVREELRETGARLWETTDLVEIFDRMCNDPALRYESPQRDARPRPAGRRRRRSGGAELVRVVPEEPCIVEPVPEAEEAGMAAAYYMPGAIDGSRRGTYFLNTSQPEERHRYAAEDIAFHEAVPGHHFQLTIASSPRTWRRRGGCSGRHRLRRGLGPLQRAAGRRNGALQRRPGPYGALRRRLVAGQPPGRRHRPARLGWTRQQAVDWLVAHTPMPRLEIESEIDRYISYPGSGAWPTWWAGARSSGSAPRRRTASARGSTSGRSTTSCCEAARSRCPHSPRRSNGGSGVPSAESAPTSFRRRGAIPCSGRFAERAGPRGQSVQDRGNVG